MGGFERSNKDWVWRISLPLHDDDDVGAAVVVAPAAAVGGAAESASSDRFVKGNMAPGISSTRPLLFHPKVAAAFFGLYNGLV